MTQATIQRKISHGYAIAAKKLGAPFAQFRPTDAIVPALDPTQQIATLNAAFDIDYRFSHRAPASFAHPIFFALVDLDDIQIADHFHRGDQTYFVANLEALRPPLVVQCNRVVSLYQPSPSAVGADFYSGNVTGLGTPHVNQWPASILLGPKGEQNASALPADPRSPWYAAILALCPGVVIRTGDVMIDDLHRRYTISAPEQTDMGWRLTASYSGT